MQSMIHRALRTLRDRFGAASKEGRRGFLATAAGVILGTFSGGAGQPAEASPARQEGKRPDEGAPGSSGEETVIANESGFSSDKSGQENTAVLNDLLREYGRVFIEAGTYDVEGSVELSHGCHLEGIGRTGKVVLNQVDDRARSLVNAYEGEGGLSYVQLDNFTLQGGRIGIDLADLRHSTLSRVRVLDCAEIGIRCYQDRKFTGYLHMTSVSAVECGHYGLVLDGLATLSTFTECSFNKNGIGVYVPEGSSLTFIGCDVTGNEEAGYRLGGGRITLIGTWHEQQMVDLHLLPGADRVYEIAPRMVNPSPRNVRVDTEGHFYTTRAGSWGSYRQDSPVNIISNGNFQFWPDGERLPPLVSFVSSSNFRKLSTAQTAEGIELTARGAWTWVEIDLTEYVPVLAGREVTVGFRWKGHPENTPVDRQFRLYHGEQETVDGVRTTYSVGEQSQSQVEQVAWANATIPEDLDNLRLRVEVTFDQQRAVGDRIVLTEVFCSLGHGLPSHGALPLTEQGGLVNDDLHVGPSRKGVTLRDRSTGERYRVFVSGGELGIEEA